MLDFLRNVVTGFVKLGLIALLISPNQFSILVARQTYSVTPIQVTDTQGQKIKIPEAHIWVQYECGSPGQISSEPFLTNFPIEGIPLIIPNADEYQYSIAVPLEIIEKLTAKGIGEIYHLREQDYQLKEYTIVLADSTSLSGNSGFFAWIDGENSEGTYAFPAVRIAEISPLNKPLTNYTASLESSNLRSGKLHLSDGTELQLDSAIFFNYTDNKNGCISGREETPSIYLRSGAIKKSIKWNDVKTISFLPDSASYDSVDTQVTLMSGDTFEGTVVDSNGENARSGILGVATIGSYKLKFEISFFTYASMLTLDDVKPNS